MPSKKVASKGGKAVVAKYGVDHMRYLASLWWLKYELKPHAGNDFLIVERATGRVNGKTLNGERYDV